MAIYHPERLNKLYNTIGVGSSNHSKSQVAIKVLLNQHCWWSHPHFSRLNRNRMLVKSPSFSEWNPHFLAGDVQERLLRTEASQLFAAHWRLGPHGSLVKNGRRSGGPEIRNDDSISAALIWLVVKGTMEFWMTFPWYWEWKITPSDEHTYFSEG